MHPLADAAFSRSEADWLVGINGTRAMTAFNSKLGGFFKTTVGRVQTPTLAILVEREEQHSQVRAARLLGNHRHVRCRGGPIRRALVRREICQTGNATTSSNRSASGNRHRPKPSAQNVLANRASSPRKASRARRLSPLLYDLTSLQRDANSRFGFSAKNTLGLAQALYERHKVLTYPRTDSRALPEDYIGTVKTTLGMLGRDELQAVRRPDFAERLGASEQTHFQQRESFRPFRHHSDVARAEIVERAGAETLRLGDEAVSGDFLSSSGISGNGPHHARRRRTVQERGQGFGHRRAGWRFMASKSDSDATPSLAPVKPGETVNTSEVEVKQNVTKPPARYSEATLLSARWKAPANWWRTMNCARR